MFPKYLAVSADFNSILCSLYAYITGFFFLDTLITSLLSGLNSVDHFIPIRQVYADQTVKFQRQVGNRL